MFDSVQEIVCPACGWRDRCDLDEMRRRVQAAGMLKRATDPEPSLIVELFSNAVKQFQCDECGEAMIAREVSEDDWPSARKCALCDKPIPSERLEAIADAKHCATCQAKIDRGEATGEREFCDFCGGVMTLRQAGGGLTRYVSRCGDCGR